ncbi:TVP38/TMEM64 family protein [Bacillus sp. FJAT-44742]|uniref:TVP38/TMEM64 family protein n=1 Tax=Bacillus sp. FJAT-44742 TaxID=2014005 RepID=UPI000C24A145|nr:TVP38/TMEM64 family protein [Bacillus sp. FJAT-44742]
MIKKAGIALLYIVIGFLIYLYGEPLIVWINEEGHNYVTITTIAATMFSLFPIIPYPVIGGIIGAAYGPFLGTIVIWIGSSAASIIMFLFVRYGYQDWGYKVLRKYKALEKVTILFEKNAFLAIFLTRLVPVVPSIAVNIYSGLSRVRFMPYAVASSAGKVPAMVLFATIGTVAVTNPWDLFYVIAVYSIFLVLCYIVYKIFKSKARAEIKPVRQVR